MNRPDPSDFRTQVTKPEDFDSFWDSILKSSDSIPLNETITLDPMRSSEDVEVYEVHYNSLDQVRIAGWYCLPRDRTEPLPTRVFYPGYISGRHYLNPMPLRVMRLLARLQGVN